MDPTIYDGLRWGSAVSVGGANTSHSASRAATAIRPRVGAGRHGASIKLVQSFSRYPRNSGSPLFTAQPAFPPHMNLFVDHSHPPANISAFLPTSFRMRLSGRQVYAVFSAVRIPRSQTAESVQATGIDEQLCEAQTG